MLGDIAAEHRAMPEITSEKLESMLNQKPPIIPWTPAEIDLLEQYVPTFHNHFTGNADDYTNPNTWDLCQRMIFQAQSEVVAKSATIDSFVMRGIHDVGTVSSKVYNFNRLAKITRLMGVARVERYSSQLVDTLSAGEVLTEVKVGFGELVDALGKYLIPSKVNREVADLTTQQKKRFAYVEDLLAIAGDHIVGIGLYGTAGISDDPSKFSDYDNYVIIKDGSTREFLEALQGKRLVNSTDGKEVGVHSIEQSRAVNYFRFTRSPSDLSHEGVILHGEIDVPATSDCEIEQRTVSYAMLNAKSLKMATLWAAHIPELFVQKQKLYDFYQKMPALIVRCELGKRAYRIQKDAVNAVLRDMGFTQTPHCDSPETLQRAIYQTSAKVSELVSHFYAGKEFDPRGSLVALK